jgi:OFA family oxalate/formate antiporter-like MFS transporter
MGRAAEHPVGNRWLIAVAGVVMQIALGAVYAWSVFKNPLIQAFGWTGPQVQTTFSIAIFTLGVAAFVGGLWMNRVGPRTVGMTAGVLYGVGVFLASLAANNLWVLYLSYGLIAGAGLGLGYIVPVATLVKWFPDRRGFITGVAVAGFGAGALITAPIATRLIQSVGVLQTFAYLGVAYLILVVGAAALMRNPPEGYAPAGWQPSAALQSQRSTRDFTLGQALGTWQWYALWALLFLNVTAGISIISQASPMAQEITGVDAAAAAGVVGLLSIANGSGRFLWAWFSDFIGRKWVFLAMFLIQAALFFIMPSISSLVLFSTLAFIIALCYGGGFGTMPAFAADYFGPKNVGTIYGLMLTAWGTAGIVGPLLLAFLRQSTGNYSNALYIIAAIMLVSAIVPFIVRPPKAQPAAPGETPATPAPVGPTPEALREREAGR